MTQPERNMEMKKEKFHCQDFLQVESPISEAKNMILKLQREAEDKEQWKEYFCLERLKELLESGQCKIAALMSRLTK